MHKLFPDAYIYTESRGTKEELNKCDVVFLAVPTPLKDGKLDVSIIDDIMGWCVNPVIVIRSAVNPGDCDRWEALGRRVCNMPEYLGETPNHPLMDESKRSFLVIGGRDENRIKVIECLQTAYNANITIRQVTNLEAEVIKLSENRAIAWKTMQAQELYDACQNNGVDYYTVRDAVYGDDPRFNLWWTFVYPDNRGFNSSKCLVKDVPAWVTWSGLEDTVTEKLVEKSNLWADAS